MDFLKKNYEKVILAIVLLGGTIAACVLPFIVTSKRAELDNLVTSTIPHPKPLPALDMSVAEAALKRAESPFTLDFTTKHNLFNPVTWKKLADGRLIKEVTGNEEGAAALEVTGIRPLYLEIKYGSTNADGYFITVDRQAAERREHRHKSSFVSKEHKGESITLLAVKGPAEKPTELDLEWNEPGDMMGEAFSISPEKPFKKIEAYAADLKYPPENKTWTDRRVGSRPLQFANDTYNIVAITESNVVVSAQSNNKKTTILLHSATEPPR